MRYSCEDIRHILGDDDDRAADAELMDGHISACRECASLIDLGPKLEDALRLSLPRPAPNGFERKLSERIRKCDSRSTVSARRNRLALYFSALIPMLLAIVAVGSQNNPVRAFSGLNFDNALNAARNLYASIKFPNIDIAGLAAVIVDTPIIFAIIISIIAITWIFSIMEFNRTLK